MSSRDRSSRDRTSRSRDDEDVQRATRAQREQPGTTDDSHQQPDRRSSGGADREAGPQARQDSATGAGGNAPTASPDGPVGLQPERSASRADGSGRQDVERVVVAPDGTAAVAEPGHGRLPTAPDQRVDIASADSVPA